MGANQFSIAIIIGVTIWHFFSISRCELHTRSPCAVSEESKNLKNREGDILSPAFLTSPIPPHWPSYGCGLGCSLPDSPPPCSASLSVLPHAWLRRMPPLPAPALALDWPAVKK